MRILKTLVRTIIFLVIGLAGTIAILFGANMLITAQNPVKPRSGVFIYIDSWDHGYVHASGTWTMENARPAFPIQTSTIKCYKDEKSCTASQAEIAFGNMLNLEMYNYDITKLYNTTILFRTDTECVEYVYTIDRPNKRLFGTRTKKPNTGAECSDVDNKAIRLTLVDGFIVWKTVNQEAESKIAPFMWIIVVVWWLLLAFLFFWRRLGRAQHIAT